MRGQIRFLKRHHHPTCPHLLKGKMHITFSHLKGFFTYQLFGFGFIYVNGYCGDSDGDGSGFGSGQHKGDGFSDGFYFGYGDCYGEGRGYGCGYGEDYGNGEIKEKILLFEEK